MQDNINLDWFVCNSRNKLFFAESEIEATSPRCSNCSRPHNYKFSENQLIDVFLARTGLLENSNIAIATGPSFPG